MSLMLVYSPRTILTGTPSASTKEQSSVTERLCFGVVDRSQIQVDLQTPGASEPPTACSRSGVERMSPFLPYDLDRIGYGRAERRRAGLKRRIQHLVDLRYGRDQHARAVMDRIMRRALVAAADALAHAFHAIRAAGGDAHDLNLN